MLAVVEVPKHGNAIFSTGGSKRAIGGNGDGVNVTLVSIVVGAELALCELPDLGKKLNTLVGVIQNKGSKTK